MKRIILPLLLIFSVVLFSQQDSHYTQYMYNMNVVNPAYAGIHKSVNVRAFSRQQWVGLEGSPTTHTFTIQSPLGKKGLGGALSLVTDNIGPVSETDIFADMSYSIKVLENSRLSFGVKAGYTSLTRDLQGLVTNEVEKYDDFPENYKAFNFGSGLFYYTKDYYVGFSIPYLLGGTFVENKSGANVGKGNSYYISGGYVYKLPDGNKLKPSFMYRGNGTSIETFDISLNMFFKNGLELGTSFTIYNALSGMINYRLGKRKAFRIGYAYEHNLSKLSEFSRGTHEIMLMYDFELSNDKFAWRGACY